MTRGTSYRTRLRDFVVRRLELGSDRRGGDDRAYWADLLDRPIAIMIDCVKA
jgi:hypothetical protein